MMRTLPPRRPEALLWVVLATTQVIAVACGGGPRTAGPSAEGTEAETPPVALGPRMAVPGTGVSLEAPANAALLPVGPGLAVDDLGLTIMVALAVGPEPVHTAFHRSLFIDGTETRRRELTIEGEAATLGRDVLPGPGGALGRAWLVTRRGDRTLAVLATYRDGGSAETEALVVRSLSTLAWDEARRLSPDRAVGIGLGAVEGLEMDRHTLGTLALTPEGIAFPPAEGEPMMFILPLPEGPAAAESLDTCAALLQMTGAVSVPDGAAVSLATPSSGCAYEGLHRSRTDQELYAYAAVVALGPGPVLLTGMVRPDGRDEWAPRFAAAAATIRHLRAPTD